MLPDLPIVYASGRYGPCNINSAVPRSVFVPKPYDLAAVCTLLKWLRHDCLAMLPRVRRA
jgi:hypothetical protein